MKTFLMVALLAGLVGIAVGQTPSLQKYPGMTWTALEIQGEHFELSFDRSSSDECVLIELRRHSDVIFSVPCNGEQDTLAEGWSRSRAYRCIHAVSMSAWAPKAEDKWHSANIAAKCSPEVEPTREPIAQTIEPQTN